MRPIHLTVSGLHSFREKQEIDFSSLCEGGVFGIFGPTGSGKSSLLDAVTLALYGKVERATNNIQGIMNHAEKQLHVAFTFELGDRSIGQRYRVERSYRRTKDDSVRTSSCRFIEIEREEAFVLADKERDVTNQVETVLGLTLTDFTRAVVLPQGKFAEFLSLKGADRRQMLQRLFHLEKYGDRLNSRLKHLVDETRTELEKILAEQQGLGNASKEALQEAELQLQNAIEVVKQKDVGLKNVTKQFEEYRQIWIWQEELLKVEQKLKEYEANLPQIEDLHKRLKKASEADSLLVYVDELDGAAKEKAYWTERKERLVQSVNQSRNIVQKTKEELSTVVEKRSIEEPVLYKRLQDYEQAQKLEVERDEKRVLFQTEKGKLVLDERKLSEQEGELNSLKTKKQLAIEKQGSIKKALEQKTISFEDRNRLREALSLKKDILLHQKTRDELLKEKQENEENKQLAVTQEQILVSKQSKYVRQVHRLLGQTEGIYNRICEHERVIEQSKDLISHSIKEAASKQKEAEIHELAKQIANQLTDGQPCPVCGSIEHPNPVIFDMSGNDFNKQRSELEEMLSNIRAEEASIGDNKRDLQHMFGTLKDYVDSNKKNTEETAATLYDPISETVSSTNELLEYLHLLQTETKGFYQDVIELIEERDDAISGLNKLDKQRIELRSKLDTLNDDMKKINKKLTECEEQLQALDTSWSSHFSTYTFDTLEKKQEEMDKLDQEAAELTQRYDTSVGYIDKVDKAIDKAAGEYQNLQLSVTKLSSTVAELNDRCQETKRKIQEICGNQPASELLQMVKLELLKLKENEAAARKHWDEENENFQNLEKELEGAKQSANQADKRVNAAVSKWEEKRNQSIFNEKYEVKEALVQSETQNQWEKEIKSFSSAYQNIQHDQKKLSERLQNKTITQEEWSNVTVGLEKAKNEKDVALSEKAGLVVTVNDLKTRTEKFEALEQKRVETEELSERLGKLQAVFRGNGFVEFIAEEQLIQVATIASERLGELTKHRYALEVDSSGGFIIRDDANGGIRRPVSSLSGGETFLTSLALALSLSAQIQLQGQHPLEFFFLDEGFGTLDPELLDTVVTALERLQMEQLSVGVISHVPELRARLPKKLIVNPAQPSGKGSTVSIETL
ncbi:SbcC/MukB-like Walker B domain-containing protein [Alkalihalobacillus sp. AL-G]|uniref:SbcC/MukB-like Walker B domain-containing protein n=1 Tax=Alkalihalobacillus sp. AL-G TaxID=2926399 RepID=UPI00272AE9D1|nr:SbcC/MukB-like Walker B domain-containing protein [Alkalihalobacillus sp. AL-G]WLD94840.1 AAA family ATPase [Alkalihalobacillus sp. AL-G]